MVITASNNKTMLHLFVVFVIFTFVLFAVCFYKWKDYINTDKTIDFDEAFSLKIL